MTLVQRLTTYGSRAERDRDFVAGENVPINTFKVGMIAPCGSQIKPGTSILQYKKIKLIRKVSLA